MTLWADSAGTGPDLVLLHGWGMNAGVWEPLLGGLQERYRVTRIELPGHGASLRQVPADLPAWAEACLAVAPPHAAWVGWSLGGLVAQQAALLAPERVGRLCLIASTPSFICREQWPAGMRPAVFEQFADALLADPEATLKRFLALQVRGVDDARPLLRQLDRALAQRPPANPQGLHDGLDLLLHGDLRAGLATVGVSTHWLFGERDTLVARATAEALQALLPGAAVEVVAGAGHAPLLSHAAHCLGWLVACHG